LSGSTTQHYKLTGTGDGIGIGFCMLSSCADKLCKENLKESMGTAKGKHFSQALLHIKRRSELKESRLTRLCKRG